MDLLACLDLKFQPVHLRTFLEIKDNAVVLDQCPPRAVSTAFTAWRNSCFDRRHVCIWSGRAVWCNHKPQWKELAWWNQSLCIGCYAIIFIEMKKKLNFSMSNEKLNDTFPWWRAIFGMGNKTKKYKMSTKSIAFKEQFCQDRNNWWMHDKPLHLNI